MIFGQGLIFYEFWKFKLFLELKNELKLVTHGMG
jgi:hypothetical protein